jgi:uncharacterized membrane-anchored protein
MNTDRRTLGWLAIASTVVFCMPCFCAGAFMVASSIINSADTTYPWAGADTGIAWVSAVATLIAVVVGVLLLRWGVKTLQTDPSSDVIK